MGSIVEPVPSIATSDIGFIIKWQVPGGGMRKVALEPTTLPKRFLTRADHSRAPTRRSAFHLEAIPVLSDATPNR